MTARHIRFGVQSFEVERHFYWSDAVYHCIEVPKYQHKRSHIVFGAIVTALVVLFGVVAWVLVIFGVLWALSGGWINLG